MANPVVLAAISAAAAGGVHYYGHEFYGYNQEAAASVGMLIIGVTFVGVLINDWAQSMDD